jgi:isochorismate synthase EntC
VGGRPSAAALEWIRANERLDRGWYAGPVGWLNAAGEGEFAVALRSGLATRLSATLYAGCGIVAGSDPEREYQESQIKLRAMLGALNGE